MDNRPIGIFDSGVGGLTVVKQVIKVMPNEKIIYFGDTARVPYGSKSKETVTKFSSQIIRFLKTKQVKAIIIACNTVSSNCYEQLVSEFPDIPILGVVKPGVESCVKATQNNVVGVIGTQATINSGAYEKGIKKSNPSITVYSRACPLFVPLAEEGWTDNEIARMTAEAYIKELLDKGIDSILLGCTHYPLLKKCISQVVGEKVTIVDPAKATAYKMMEFLTENNMLCDNQRGEHTFYVSDNNQQFDKVCNMVLNESQSAEKIDIERY